MAIQVRGILKDPINVPIGNATIRITSLETEEAVVSAFASIKTGVDGTYDFNLLNGKYSIEVLQHNKYIKVAYITITSGTVSPITLEALINTYAYCEVTAPTCPV